MPPNISTSCGKIPTCRRTCPFVSRKWPHPAGYSNFSREIPDMPREVRTSSRKSRTCRRTFQLPAGKSRDAVEHAPLSRGSGQHPVRHSNFSREIPDMPREVRTSAQKSPTCDRTFEYLRRNSSFLAEILDMRRNELSKEFVESSSLRMATPLSVGERPQ